MAVEKWTLYRNEEPVADLTVTGRDWPWVHARVEERPGFAELRPSFEEDLREMDDDYDGDPARYRKVRASLGLRFPDGTAVPHFLLHIDGDEAWWRYAE